MQSIDLNLLVVLDALLQEGSVSGAARRLHLSPPAVSRSLARLRTITGDPLLVRAGRNLVPTPVAERMRDRTHEVVAAVYEVLTPPQVLSDRELEATLDRVFTVRTGPDNAGGFGPALLAEISSRAPRVRVHLVGDGMGAVEALRDGQIDLDLGGGPVSDTTEKVHRETLLTDSIVIVGRTDGAFAKACRRRNPNPGDLARHPHVNRSPESIWHPVLDRGLADDGLERTVVATAPGFAAAFAMVRRGDLICLAPQRLTSPMLGPDLRSWPSPIALPQLQIEQSWHHRSHTDPEHRWLRDRVRAAAMAVAAAS